MPKRNTWTEFGHTTRLQLTRRRYTSAGCGWNLYWRSQVVAWPGAVQAAGVREGEQREPAYRNWTKPETATAKMGLGATSRPERSGTGDRCCSIHGTITLRLSCKGSAGAKRQRANSTGSPAKAGFPTRCKGFGTVFLSLTNGRACWKSRISPGKGADRDEF
jgi:hypothetical protein